MCVYRTYACEIFILLTRVYELLKTISMKFAGRRYELLCLQTRMIVNIDTFIVGKIHIIFKRVTNPGICRPALAATVEFYPALMHY